MAWDSTFSLVAVILVLAAVVGAFATKLQQPLIVAFIGVGVLLGPAALGRVQEDSEVVLLAELGVAVLLFLVGPKLDLHLIRTTGPVAVVTGLGQVVCTSLIGSASRGALGLGVLPGGVPRGRADVVEHDHHRQAARTSVSSTSSTAASRWGSSSCRTSPSQRAGRGPGW